LSTLSIVSMVAGHESPKWLGLSDMTLSNRGLIILGADSAR